MEIMDRRLEDSPAKRYYWLPQWIGFIIFVISAGIAEDTGSVIIFFLGVVLAFSSYLAGSFFCCA